MTGGLFEYPAQAAFGRVLPKSKVFAFGSVSRRVKDLFAAEIERIVWRFKLAPETVNLPAAPGVTEIQIFGVELKPGIEELTEDVLRCIDNAIGFPIVFEIVAPTVKGARVKVVAAYKRPSEADTSKWVVGDYVSTEWVPADAKRSTLPVTLNLGSLYDQMLRQLMPVAGRPGESLKELAERQRLIAVKQRELVRLEQQLRREKQFNRRVEINGQMREVKAAVDALTEVERGRD
ncbi:MAG: DUF4391 domain-containing protein [Planctomycetia bacterium]|nr:MAG: DUF4391 domain-containing protein [Planctomycetia bacterium]